MTGVDSDDSVCSNPSGNVGSEREPEGTESPLDAGVEFGDDLGAINFPLHNINSNGLGQTWGERFQNGSNAGWVAGAGALREAPVIALSASKASRKALQPWPPVVACRGIDV